MNYVLGAKKLSVKSISFMNRKNLGSSLFKISKWVIIHFCMSLRSVDSDRKDVPVPRPASPYPTPVEAEILSVVWTSGPSSVRDVHDVVGKSRENAYSSVATIMRIMAKKGLLKVTDARRPVKFGAAVERTAIGKAMTQDLINRVFGGSLAEMLKHAIPGKKRSAAEIAEIKKLLRSLD